MTFGLFGVSASAGRLLEEPTVAECENNGDLRFPSALRKAFFMAGTDSAVGKHLIRVALLEALGTFMQVGRGK